MKTIRPIWTYGMQKIIRSKLYEPALRPVLSNSLDASGYLKDYFWKPTGRASIRDSNYDISNYNFIVGSEPYVLKL